MMNFGFKNDGCFTMSAFSTDGRGYSFAESTWITCADKEFYNDQALDNDGDSDFMENL